MITEKERRFELLSKYMPEKMALSKSEDNRWEFLIKCFGTEEKFIEEMEEKNRKLAGAINTTKATREIQFQLSNLLQVLQNFNGGMVH